MPERVKKLPLAAWIVAGLVVGAAAGLALPATGMAPWSDLVVATADVVGKLWLATLQMTILPLVFALLSTAFVRSAGLSESKGLARRTIVTLLALYLLAILVGLVFTPILLALSPVTPEIAAAMRGAAGDPGPVAHLPIAEMILGIVPTNVVSAAASGSLLPVVVFAMVFGAALARIGSERNTAIVAVLEGLAAAMFTVVGWVIMLAPVGVAAFILVATNTGGSALLWGLAHYVVLYSVLMLILTAFAYPVAVFAGRARFALFARAMLPVQVVALSTRSSLALPAARHRRRAQDRRARARGRRGDAARRRADAQQLVGLGGVLRRLRGDRLRPPARPGAAVRRRAGEDLDGDRFGRDSRAGDPRRHRGAGARRDAHPAPVPGAAHRRRDHPRHGQDGVQHHDGCRRSDRGRPGSGTCLGQAAATLRRRVAANGYFRVKTLPAGNSFAIG